MEIAVRSAGVDDAPTLGALNRHVQTPHAAARPDLFAPHEQAAVADWFATLLRQPHVLAVIAEVGGDAVGYALAEHRPAVVSPLTTPSAVLYVHHMAVAPRARRRGVGRALLGWVESAARERGADRIALDVWSFNADALGFYRALGFEEMRVVLERPVPGRPGGGTTPARHRTNDPERRLRL